MTKTITVTVTEDAINNLESFVDSAVNDKEEYLDNWAKGDGYTEEDFKAANETINEVKAFMAGLKAALEAEPGEQTQKPEQTRVPANNLPLTPTHIRHGWAIYSANEAATKDGAGFWNNRDGWSLEEGAVMYPPEWVGHYALPMSLGQDRKWVNLPLARQTTESELFGALAVFCESQNLPHQSADELLAREDLKAFQSRWLEQFIRQWEAAMDE
jgi:hypothetical protein